MTVTVTSACFASLNGALHFIGVINLNLTNLNAFDAALRIGLS